MLWGREPECERLGRLLDAARGLRSGVLVLGGEPGVGKSALVDHAVRTAHGLQVRQVRAAETEQGLPFAGLSALLRPWEHEIGRLPPVQAAALRGALALGPPVGGDRFAVAAATLGLLTAAAEGQPMLLALDDFHRMDEASAEAVLFAARRLDREGIAVLIGTRVPPPEWETLHLAGLDTAAATELLTAHGGTVADDVAERLARDTGGNPLALIELARLLGPDHLTGRAALPVPLPVGRATTALFAPRLADLRPGRRSALLLAALTDTDVDTVAAAARELGLPPEAVTELDDGGLVTLDGGRVAFAHPLVRSAVVEVAGPARVRAAHGALARVLTGPAHADRRAWHLSASVVGRNEEAAAELERMADRMRDKRAYRIASVSYERAARLTADRERYGRCRFQAAAAAWFAGQFHRARDLVAEATADETDGDWAAEAQYVLGGIELFLGHPGHAVRRLADSAARHRATAVEVAVRRQLDAVLAAYVGNDFPVAAELATAAAAWGSTDRALTGLAHLLAGVSVLACGDPERGAHLLQAAVDVPELVRGHGLDGQHAVHAAHELVRVGMPTAAKRILDPLVEGLRADAELGMLPYALHIAAVAEAGSGQLNAAFAAASESARLGRETGNPLWHYRGTAVLAYVQAVRGEEDDCRQRAAEARRLGEQLGTTSARYIDEALAALEFALGHTEAALAHTADVGYFRVCSSALLLTWPGAMDVAEAHVRGGHRLPHALAAALERTLAGDIAAALPGQAAGLARLRALTTADGDEAEELFGRAVAGYTGAGLRLEAARTQLSWGQRLRRQGGRTAARARLRAAHAGLEAMGARLWAGRALAELRATGLKHLPAAGRPEQPLTPQEMQVALAVSGGATNREAAAALFLSTKTVEMHLTQVYRKLGLRSRTELARRFADEHD
ncbi:LuxR C-terminal-related transcriptional regulator [Streptomyces sp. SCA3-4]|uniref:helix-turn-helix transcriptional regulator n=1 Tax=Streptomyces sichuanensis TaxID=2871810 RepID=UPI001CE25763|nr:helix-turn-helix transcriptional regulator [Streptomyces sichuanensis]MCA6095196.1 LuxR C-terminal-related transcriptional regulator [Streptomyces sichuanensis]